MKSYLEAVYIPASGHITFESETGTRVYAATAKEWKQFLEFKSAYLGFSTLFRGREILNYQ